MTASSRPWCRTLVHTLLGAGIVFGVVACDQAPSGPSSDRSGALELAKGPPSKNQEPAALDPATVMNRTNAALASEDAPYRLGIIQTLSADSQPAGITLLWKNVGNKKLGHDFVPGDPRRAAATGGWSEDPNSITYAIDPFDGTTFNGVGPATTSGEIRDGLQTWNVLSCSNIDLTEVASPVDLGVIAFQNDLGGSPFVVADIQYGGWLEVEYDGPTIAATHTFIWVDDDGNPTDIDRNGYLDVAFREIYFDKTCQACAGAPTWTWEIDNGINDPGFDIDIESISLHETGHGLSQGHFGIGFVNDDGTLYQTSNSVMAAAYAGPRTDLQGSDTGGHCTNWGEWPQK